jgi:hypothetical protein
MIPGRYDLKKYDTHDDTIYQGDTYRSSVMSLPRDLSALGGSSDISDATFTSQLRTEDGELAATFTVSPVAIEASVVKVRLTMAPAVSATVPITGAEIRCFYDLQISKGGWVGTILRGAVKTAREETR